MSGNIKKIALTIVVVLIALGVEKFSGNTNTSGGNGQHSSGGQVSQQAPSLPGNQKAPSVDNKEQILKKISDAKQNQRSGWWLTTKGKVIKLLKDDTKGSQHQKFIIELARGVTLLVAHNIDLAPRANVKKGDVITLRARYEWNNRGGVLHWTHHDPKGRQKGGWIYNNGRYFK